jgi:hypothetical protein
MGGIGFQIFKKNHIIHKVIITLNTFNEKTWIKI